MEILIGLVIVAAAGAGYGAWRQSQRGASAPRSSRRPPAIARELQLEIAELQLGNAELKLRAAMIGESSRPA